MCNIMWHALKPKKYGHTQKKKKKIPDMFMLDMCLLFIGRNIYIYLFTILDMVRMRKGHGLDTVNKKIIKKGK